MASENINDIIGDVTSNEYKYGFVSDIEWRNFLKE
jgi:hypothetical protein